MAPTHPLYGLPFHPPIANALREEYLAMPWPRRWQARRKAALRMLGLHLGGQGRLLHQRIPSSTRRLLLVYSWTTVGDAIMDLSARHLVPPGIRVDLCIAPHLAALFVADPAFGQVVAHPDELDGPPDFVLLDCLTSALLRDKSRRWPDLPFASLRGQLIGERYDRTAYADRRMRQLFGLPPGPVEAPRLAIGDGRPGPSDRLRVAVALGARRPERAYPHWPEVLARLVARWPDGRPPPEFWLLGADNGVGELAGFDAAFLRDRCVVRVGAGTLGDTAAWLGGCDAFVGVDGGLMHVAIALQRPGLALFTHSDPAYFAPRAGAMQVLHRPGPPSAVAPHELVGPLLAVVAGVTPRHPSPAAAGPAFPSGTIAALPCLQRPPSSERNASAATSRGDRSLTDAV